MKCGNDEISWLSFRQAVLLISNKAEGRPITIHDSLMRSATSCVYSVNLPFEKLIWLSSGRRYSEDHDRIYALLNLAPARLAEFIPADYSLPSMEVFRGVFWAHLNETRRMNLLRFCNFSNRAPGGAIRPSWLPDLRYHDGSNFPPIEDPFCATSMSAARVRRVTSEEIQIAGFSIGTVSSVEQFPCLGDMAEFLQGQNRDWERSQYPGGPPRREALVRTLALDRLRPRWKIEHIPYLREAEHLLMATDHGSTAWIAAIKNRAGYKAIFSTADGYIGIGSQHMRTGK